MISGSFIVSESNNKDSFDPINQEIFIDPNVYLQEYNTEMKVILNVKNLGYQNGTKYFKFPNE